jgi:hypothetical protein
MPNLNLTGEQYRDLVRALEVATSVYAFVGDTAEDGVRCREIADRLDALEQSVLGEAAAFDQADLVEDFEGDTVLNDKTADEILEDLGTYDDFVAEDRLVAVLTAREMNGKFTLDQRKKMTDKEWFEAMAATEDKYWERLEKEGLDFIEARQ